MALIKTYERNNLYRIHGRLELMGFDAGDCGLGLAKRRERECRSRYRKTGLGGCLIFWGSMLVMAA